MCFMMLKVKLFYFYEIVFYIYMYICWSDSIWNTFVESVAYLTADHFGDGASK